jgi:cytochrome P450
MTYHLLRTPTVLNHLTTLLRTTFPTEESITIASTAAIPYLTLCIEEALRIYPPVPTSFPRKTTSSGGAVICDAFVPTNTIVGVYQWAAYSSTRNFTDPEKFVPERWVREEEFEKEGLGRYKKDMERRGVVKAFSVGPRNCLGKK